ncbi:bacteriorhodopsin, partial [uncultured Hymenobacter sp.]|uniref:bacteriorhodopsin n=1 Tax=uncultured Hymenobacter sp. TaxID=170016 RepID=UPI0035CAF04C
MQFSTSFIPTAAEVSVLSMVTYFTLTVAVYAFLGSLIFALATKASVAPEHRLSRVYGAIIAAVAGLSYVLITYFYHELLHELAHYSNDPDSQKLLIRRGYNAIGQYRYLDWAVTTPLLLLKMTSMLRLRFERVPKQLTGLLLADGFMVLTGYIGEQQLTPAGGIQVGAKLLWGAISTLGYLVIPYLLWQFWQRHAADVTPVERRAYRLMALTTVTTWGVYPVGYVLSCFPESGLNYNWLHLAFTVADLVNKVGVAALAYHAGKKLLD